MSGSVLVLKGLRCRIGGLQVLSGIDLSVGERAIVGLIGSNGSGKTTLLNVVNGFTRFQSGSIQLGGREISRLPVHERSARGIGRVFQESRVWPAWTVREHLAIASNHSRARDKTIARIVQDDKSFAEKQAGTLSLLSRRKLELAMAALSGSQILLADEIGAGLNAGEARSLYEHVAALVRAGHCRAAIMVEHKIDLLLSFATELCFLNEGRVSERVACADREKVTALVGQMMAPVVWGGS